MIQDETEIMLSLGDFNAQIQTWETSGRARRISRSEKLEVFKVFGAACHPKIGIPTIASEVDFDVVTPHTGGA